MRARTWVGTTGSRALIAAIWALCVWSSALAVRAQQPSAAEAESPHYLALIHDALAEMNAGNFAEARALFLKAHLESPSARTLRGLGYVEYELRRYTESVRYLRQALREPKRALEPAMRRDSELTLERALAYTGRFQLQLQPADAELLVDGQPPSFEPDGALWLDVGKHELLLSAPGYVSLRHELIVSGAESEPLALSLVRTELALQPGALTLQPSAAAAAGEPAASPPGDGGSLIGKWWFWTAIGVVVVGAAVGIGLAASKTETQAALPGNLGVTSAVLVRR